MDKDDPSNKVQEKVTNLNDNEDSCLIQQALLFSKNNDSHKMMTVENVGNKKPAPVCKDFRNNSCCRAKCKFLHLTSEEEAEYNNTGILPAHGGEPTNSHNSSFTDNVCRDFLNGKCKRGKKCKFNHLSENQLQSSLNMLNKKACLEYNNKENSNNNKNDDRDNDVELVNENIVLMGKIAEVENEISRLRKMNDTLYEENTRYRKQARKSMTDNDNNTNQVLSYNSQPHVPTYPQNPTTYLQNYPSYPVVNDSYPQFDAAYAQYTQYSAYLQYCAAYSQYHSQQGSTFYQSYPSHTSSPLANTFQQTSSVSANGGA